jgi:hypothetical protein
LELHSCPTDRDYLPSSPTARELPNGPPVTGSAERYNKGIKADAGQPVLFRLKPSGRRRLAVYLELALHAGNVLQQPFAG